MEAFTVLFNEFNGVIARTGIAYHRDNAENAKSKFHVGTCNVMCHYKMTEYTSSRYFWGKEKINEIISYLDSLNKKGSIFFHKDGRLWVPRTKFYQASILKKKDHFFLIEEKPEEKSKVLLLMRGSAGRNTDVKIYFHQGVKLMVGQYNNSRKNSSSREALLCLTEDTVNRSSVVFKITNKVTHYTTFYELLWNGKDLLLYKRPFAIGIRKVIRGNEKPTVISDIKELNKISKIKEDLFYEELDKVYNEKMAL